MTKSTFDVNAYSIIQEVQSSLLNGRTHTWYEYIPRAYTESKEVPLVITLHGTGLTGRTMLDFSGWHFTAEREGFIVVSPNASHGIYWDYSFDGDDMKYLKNLILHVCDKYKIDKSRIYMHGLSNGDMMSLAFAIKHGYLLAGLGSSIGPTYFDFLKDSSGKLITPVSPLPVYQWRGESDAILALPGGIRAEDANIRGEVNDFNKQYWMECNGNDYIPEIRIKGGDNTEIYTGGKVNFIYHEVKDAPHRSDIYAVDQMWKELFSGYARLEDLSTEGNSFTPYRPIDMPKGDDNAIAIVEGLPNALMNNRKIKIDDESNSIGYPICLDDTIYVPAFFMSKAFNLTMKSGKESNGATFFGKNIKLEIVVDSNKVLMNDREIEINNEVKLYKDVLMVPLQCIAESLFNKYTSFNHGALYIANHANEISKGIARTLERVLKNGGI